MSAGDIPPTPWLFPTDWQVRCESYISRREILGRIGSDLQSSFGNGAYLETAKLADYFPCSRCFPSSRSESSLRE